MITPNKTAMIRKLHRESFSKKGLPDLQKKKESKARSTKIFFQENQGASVLGPSEKFDILKEIQRNSDSYEVVYRDNGISTETYFKGKDELGKNLTQDRKFSLVLEGKTGISSIAEICRRESVEHETFLEWCREFVSYRKRHLGLKGKSSSAYYKKKRALVSKVGSDVIDYLELFLNLEKTVVLESKILSASDSFEDIDLQGLVYLNKLNDERYINKSLERINSKLKQGDVFIGCFETFKARRNRLSVNKVPIVRDLFFSFEFLFKRILPKISFTKKLYFDFTKGNDRLLSKAEGLGRLVSCGFKIMDYKTINGLTYFVVQKEKEPYFDLNPSYGPIFKMSRIGKDGETIGVYKFRTMHPYSEYLQDYVVNANGYGKKGKPANDFRVPVWGKFMRRFWLDELPQLINVLKGEMKLVGIRPVSARYFQDIPTEMQKLRITQKPGCVPPYVALNRNSDVMSVLQAEREYLEAKLRNPYFTDCKYLLKALFNIIIRSKRSS
jgi:lipopolysaccharide/colanic/teichoic acid biosynthesis glycosyltransferase/transposase-like protein